MKPISRRNFTKALAGLVAFIPAARQLAKAPPVEADCGCPCGDPQYIACYYVGSTCYQPTPNPGSLFDCYQCDDVRTGTFCYQDCQWVGYCYT